jgi:membrane protease YdiL (CAAX protease family)
MISHIDAVSLNQKLSFRIALWMVILLWMANVFLFALYLEEPFTSVIGFLPGLLGVIILSLSGFRRADCYLRFGWISWVSLGIYILMLTLMVPVVLMGIHSVNWAGWDWVMMLIYAPASGIAQELFFRSTLLPALRRAFTGRAFLALIISSLMFALYHAGMFLVAPAGVAAGALVVTFLAGMGWGWQVGRDRTVLWAMVHHTLLQMILRVFAWM